MSREGGAAGARARRRASLGLASGPAPGGGGGGGGHGDLGYGYEDDRRGKFQGQGQSRSFDDVQGGGRRRAGRRGSATGIVGGAPEHQRSLSSDGTEMGQAGRQRRVRRGSVSSGLDGIPGMAAVVDAATEAPPPPVERAPPPQEHQNEQQDRRMRGAAGGGRRGRRRQSLTSGTTAVTQQFEDLGYGDSGPDLGYGDDHGYDDDRAARDRTEKQRKMMADFKNKSDSAYLNSHPSSEDLGYGDNGFGGEDPFANDPPPEEEQRQGGRPKRRTSITGRIGLGAKNFSSMEDEKESRSSKATGAPSQRRRAPERIPSSDLGMMARQKQAGASSSRHAGDRDRMRPGGLLERVGGDNRRRAGGGGDGGGGGGGGGTSYSDRIMGHGRR